MKKNLKNFYITDIRPYLKKKFNYNNVHQLPKIKSIQINRGLGNRAQNTKILQKSIEEFCWITGQKPILTRAKNSISGFKLRKNSIIGLMVTLRREKMYSFLDRLINLTLPRIPDFHGLDPKKFDKNGNYTFGITTQSIFPEITFEEPNSTLGLNITIVTSGKTTLESLELLIQMGLPFAK